MEGNIERKRKRLMTCDYRKEKTVVKKKSKRKAKSGHRISVRKHLVI
jgi:hypothetical protein